MTANMSMASRYEQLPVQMTKRLRFASHDPLAGLTQKNVENMEKEIRKQRIFHMDYNPQFKSKDSRFFQKQILGLPQELITADDVAAGDVVYDPRYMKKPSNPPKIAYQTKQGKELEIQFSKLKQQNSMHSYFNQIKNDMESDAVEFQPPDQTQEHQLHYVEKHPDYNPTQRQKQSIARCAARKFPNTSMEMFRPLNKMIPKDIVKLKALTKQQLAEAQAEKEFEELPPSQQRKIRKQQRQEKRDAILAKRLERAKEAINKNAQPHQAFQDEQTDPTYTELQQAKCTFKVKDEPIQKSEMEIQSDMMVKAEEIQDQLQQVSIDETAQANVQTESDQIHENQTEQVSQIEKAAFQVQNADIEQDEGQGAILPDMKTQKPGQNHADRNDNTFASTRRQLANITKDVNNLHEHRAVSQPFGIAQTQATDYDGLGRPQTFQLTRGGPTPSNGSNSPNSRQNAASHLLGSQPIFPSHLTASQHQWAQFRSSITRQQFNHKHVVACDKNRSKLLENLSQRQASQKRSMFKNRAQYASVNYQTTTSGFQQLNQQNAALFASSGESTIELMGKQQQNLLNQERMESVQSLNQVPYSANDGDENKIAQPAMSFSTALLLDQYQNQNLIEQCDTVTDIHNLTLISKKKNCGDLYLNSQNLREHELGMPRLAKLEREKEKTFQFLAQDESDVKTVSSYQSRYRNEIVKDNCTFVNLGEEKPVQIRYKEHYEISKRRRKQALTEALDETRLSELNNVQNLSSENVLRKFRDDQLNMSTFIRGLNKSKPERQWKPDKFKVMDDNQPGKGNGSKRK